MNNFYFPPSIPYLNDNLFVSYGFFTGTSTQFQRYAAYAIAENLLEQELGTTIKPVTVTGSYAWINPSVVIEAGIGMINSINHVMIHEKWSNNTDRIISGTSYLVDPTSGLFMVDVSPNDNSSCIGCGGSNGIYKVEVSMTVGYSTGVVVGNRTLELALCMIADIILPQMFDVGIGFEYWTFDKTIQVGRTIKTVSDKFLLDTSFGQSARAQFIRRLISPYKIYSAKKLGR